MSGGSVRVGRTGRRAEVVIDRPPLNILDLAAIAELDEHLGELAGDESLQLVVVRGAGERAFSAGVAVEDHTPDRIEAMLRGFHGTLHRLRSLPAVTLAVVRGHCLGGGMELASACDLVLAAEESRFGQPEVKLGCFPPYAAALYPARFGRARTLELLISGRTFGGAEAAALGFATWTAPAAELERRLEEIAHELLTASGAVTRIIKRAVAAAAPAGFETALTEAERLYLDELARTDDMEEGLVAFFEKRAPRWRHR